MALHQLIRSYKSGSDLSWMWNNSGHLFFFPFFFCFACSVGLLCSGVHVKESNIVLKACAFHES